MAETTFTKRRGIDARLRRDRDSLLERTHAAETEVARLTALLNTPTLEPFTNAVVAEAQHQVYRHGIAHDARKDAYDWLWLLAYLVGKAARSATDGDHDKAMHHTITAAAALANWHKQIMEHRDIAKSNVAKQPAAQ